MGYISINDNVREQLVKYVDKLLLKGKNIDEVTDLIRDNLYSIETKNDLKQQKNKENVIQLLYLDSYKLLTYKNKVGILSDEDLLYTNNIINIESMDELTSELSAEIDLFSRMIKECYNYSKLNSFSKTIIIKSLSNDENQYLSKYFRLHFFDLISYNKKINIDDIINFMSEIIIYQEKNIGEILYNNNVKTLLGFLEVLYKYDTDNTIDLLLNMARIDYSACKHISKYIIDDIVLDHIDYYENYSFDDIINRLINDTVFLNDVIFMFIALYFDRKYESVNLSEDIFNADECKKTLKKLYVQKKDH